MFSTNSDRHRSTKLYFTTKEAKQLYEYYSVIWKILYMCNHIDI